MKTTCHPELRCPQANKWPKKEMKRQQKFLTLLARPKHSSFDLVFNISWAGASSADYMGFMSPLFNKCANWWARVVLGYSRLMGPLFFHSFFSPCQLCFVYLGLDFRLCLNRSKTFYGKRFQYFWTFGAR
jgi:hypothetical protein